MPDFSSIAPSSMVRAPIAPLLSWLMKVCLQDALLQFRRLRYLAELVVRHDDAIVVVVLYIIAVSYTHLDGFIAIGQ